MLVRSNVFLTNLRRPRESRGGGQDALLAPCTLTCAKLRQAANYATNKLSDVLVILLGSRTSRQSW